MENSEKYEKLEQDGAGLPSTMGVYPSDGTSEITTDTLKQNLLASKNIELISFRREKDDDFSISTCCAHVNYLGEEYEVFLYVIDASRIDLNNYLYGNWVDSQSVEKAKEQKYYIETSMYFGDNNLQSFHLQLKIMDAICPNAALVIDFMAFKLLSAQWLKMTAASSIPPSPDYIYSLHSIYDDKEGEDKPIYWFHTHGLHRCGVPELEMINIRGGAQQLHTLLNMVVKKFLTDPAKEKEQFAIGYDGMGINLCWLRWEEALAQFPKDVLGGIADRVNDSGEQGIHGEPAGILFAVEDSNMISPEIYSKTLEENPIFYISTEESNRMSLLARERFDLFAKAFEILKPKTKKGGLLSTIFKKKDDEPQASFIVKLGLLVDDHDDETQKEHLWFNVIDITEKGIYGKLLNQPYWIAQLKEGDKHTYPLDVLTDWVINTPDSSYTPDSIYAFPF